MTGRRTKAGEATGRRKGGWGLDRLATWAAIGVVVASVSSAIAVLGHAVHDEHATHDDAVYRQQLVAEQQIERRREEDIAADEALFGGYEQHVLRARELQQNATALAGNPQLAAALRSRAEGQRAIATALLDRFHVPPWEATAGSGLFYDPSIAYRLRSDSTESLEQVLEPGEHRLESRRARNSAISMAGVAALFLLAALLFTCAPIAARLSLPKPLARAPGLKRLAQVLEPPANGGEPAAEAQPFLLYGGYALLGLGALVWLFAASLGLSAAP